jgi:hypothetical protein
MRTPKLILLVAFFALASCQAASETPAAPNPAATALPSPAPTEDLTALIPLFADWPGDKTEIYTFESPSGELLVNVILKFDLQLEGEAYYYSRVDVMVNEQWTYSPFEDVRRFGLGYLRPEVFAWSADGQRFYLSERAVVDGCAPFAYLENIYVVDLAQGSTQLISAPVSGPAALSPDEQNLAYLIWNGENYTVYLFSLTHENTFSQVLYEPDVQSAGAITWSPDSSSFVFNTLSDPCPLDSGSKVLGVPLSDFELQLFLDSPDATLIIQSWDAAGILLRDQANETLWRLDPFSRELTPAK